MVERYDLETNRWENVADLPVTLYDHAGCWDGNKLYVSGGKSHQTVFGGSERKVARRNRNSRADYDQGKRMAGKKSNVLYCYDPTNNKWTTKVKKFIQNFYLTCFR